MSGSPRSTRRLALLAVGLSALLVTAGCAGGLGGLGADGDGGGPQLDSVPASAEYVAYVDAAGMASDDSLRSIANAALEARAEYDDEAPADVDAMLERTENASGLDPEKIESVTVFGKSADDPMAGNGQAAMLLSSSYTEDELVSAMEEQDGDLTEGSYGDTTLYSYESNEFDERTLAVLGDGEFVLGDRSAVENALDVRAGDADKLGGDLKASFQNTRGDGYVRFAMAVPSDDLPTEDVAGDAPLDASTLQTVEYVSMSFATGGGNVTTTMHLVSASESDAEQTYDLVDGAVSLYASMGSEQAADALDAVSVEQDGDTVTVTHSDTAENVESLVKTMYSAGPSMSGTSDSNSAAVAPVTAAATPT